jgi:hypothetical protein
MRLAVISTLRKFVVFILILVISITHFATPASASEGYSSEVEPTNSFAKNVTDAGTAFFTPVAICFAADAVATTVFPPAAMLAPYCASMGLTPAIAQAAVTAAAAGAAAAAGVATAATAAR